MTSWKGAAIAVTLLLALVIAGAIAGCARRAQTPQTPPMPGGVGRDLATAPEHPAAGEAQPSAEAGPAEESKPAQESKPIVLTSENFDDVIVNGDKPAVVDFWATWCPPCRVQGPIVDKIAKRYAGKITAGKVNVDEAEDLSKQFNIEAIPTLVFFKDGKEVNRLVGLTQEDELARTIDSVLLGK